MPSKVLVVRARADGPSAVCSFIGQEFACVIGRNGAVAAESKREGDGRTPLGRYALVEGFYRPDRVEPAGICRQALRPDMGWCDATDDPLYNKPCPADYAASHEEMWMESHCYDYLGVMDYNLDGQVAGDGMGRGSAIFLHIWAEKDHTAGCVALRVEDLRAVLDAGCDAVEVVLA